MVELSVAIAMTGVTVPAFSKNAWRTRQPAGPKGHSLTSDSWNAVLAVPSSARTIPATPCNCFVHDTSNGACAAAALWAAAKAAVNLPRLPRHPTGGKRCPHVMVAKYIARTDDHGGRQPLRI